MNEPSAHDLFVSNVICVRADMLAARLHLGGIENFRPTGIRPAVLVPAWERVVVVEFRRWCDGCPTTDLSELAQKAVARYRARRWRPLAMRILNEIRIGLEVRPAASIKITESP